MSEQDLGIQQADFEKKPLSQISFEEVYGAFRGFKPPESGQDRGGFIVSKPPSNRPGHQIPIYSGTEEMFIAAHSYHGESTFDPAQRYYAALTDATLAGLTYNQSLSALIVESAKNKERPLFSVAIRDSVLAILKTFGEMKESSILMPALDAMLKNAGSGGIAIAVRFSTPFLAESLDGSLVDDSREEFKMPKSFFVGLHPKRNEPKADEVYDWEVQCRGEAFARAIMNRAMTAAIELASDQDFVRSYDPGLEKIETDIAECVRNWSNSRMKELLAEKGL